MSCFLFRLSNGFEQSCQNINNSNLRQDWSGTLKCTGMLTLHVLVLRLDIEKVDKRCPRVFFCSPHFENKAKRVSQLSLVLNSLYFWANSYQYLLGLIEKCELKLKKFLILSLKSWFCLKHSNYEVFGNRAIRHI